MDFKHLLALLLIIPLLFLGCNDNTTPESDPDPDPDPEPQRGIGYEILQIFNANNIVVWFSSDITQEEFDEIILPGGWAKNQPREGEPDKGLFHRSPDALQDSMYVDQEWFGHVWRHVATIVDSNVELENSESLLVARDIAKYHSVSYNAGRTIYLLTSPGGEQYVRITRDAGRTSNTPTIPQAWDLREEVLSEEITFDLPNPTLNIRADNEDSFQGPVEY